MARKVIDITHAANKYDILSQTPKNYSADNYFIKELQDKVDADWEYRPNRVDIEYENQWGEQTYSPIEVVIQSVKSEKGTAISNDCRNIVFRDILDKRFVIGSRFRYEEFPLDELDLDAIPDAKKNVWLATNTNSVQMTSSMIIERCNGTLGSLWVDSQGISHYHYEPVIQGRELSSVNLFYNETAVSPQSELIIIAQHNDYTRDYFLNQRFIIGYDRVYRIKAINKFYSNSTFHPTDIGLMRIYMEITEISPLDDFEHRIAAQADTPVIVTDVPGDAGGKDAYSIQFSSPDFITYTLSEEFESFIPVLKHGEDVVQGVDIKLDISLENLLEARPENYYELVIEGGVFKLRRKRIYLRGPMHLKWYVKAEDSPTQEEISAEFDLDLS